jgi:N-acetylmannosamine-6-phosphate 2-epimerase/N-acetylmannosamine kinase
MEPVLAFDLGGSKILAALVAGASVIDRAEVATAREAGPEAWIEQMAEIAARWDGRYGRLGVTVTGLVREGRWSALNPGVLAIPPDYPLAEQVRKRLGQVAVIANDAQAAAWGEHVHGAGQGRDMVFLTVSTGIGGGVVLGGRLLVGRGGLAGSFGQLGPFAEAGARVEDIAAGRWIALAAAGRAGDARAVFAAAQAGDAWAEGIVAQSAERVARLCANVQLALDPGVIVIGGGVGLAPGYLGRVEAALAPLAGPLCPQIVPAALGAAAGAIGIAALAAAGN